MIYLDERQTVLKWTDSEELRSSRGAACRARRPQDDNRAKTDWFGRFSADGRSASATRGRSKQRPYTGLAIAAALLGVGGGAVLAAWAGELLQAIARAPGFAINPDVADAIAGADWLGPAIRGGAFVDAIGAAIAAVTLIALLALRIRQRIDAGSRDGVEEAAGVYKIVTNQTKADDRRSVAWFGLTSSPVCERVKSVMCG